MAERSSIAERSKVRFEPGSVECVGYLHDRNGGYPDRGGEKLPCVVSGSGFSGTQDTDTIRYAAEEMVTAGSAALTFDYRNFGESDGTPRQLASVRGQQRGLPRGHPFCS